VIDVEAVLTGIEQQAMRGCGPVQTGTHLHFDSVRIPATHFDALGAAVRAALDIHRPAVAAGRPVCDACLNSFEDQVDYPCRERRAITEALGVAA
jgi:hypothetical protein